MFEVTWLAMFGTKIVPPKSGPYFPDGLAFQILRGFAMAIEFSCGQCDARLKLPDTAAGRRGRCRKCGHVFTVPSPPADDGEIDLAAFSEPVAPIQPIAPMTPVINPKANTPAAKRRITLATHPLQASLCLVGGALGVGGERALPIYGVMGIFRGQDTSRAWHSSIVRI